jgi:hypothetical protein
MAYGLGTIEGFASAHAQAPCSIRPEEQERLMSRLMGFVFLAV